MRNMRIIAVLALVVGAFFALSAGPALAGGTPTVSLTQQSWSFGSVDLQGEQSSTNVVRGLARLNGKIEVMAEMPHGLPKSQQHGCFWGDAAWSESQVSSGGNVWAPPGHHGWTHMCHSSSSPTGLRQIGGCTKHNGEHVCSWGCGNPVVLIHHQLPPHAVKVKLSQIVVVNHFTFTVTVNAKAVQAASLTAFAFVNCGGGNASGATSSATGYGSAYASSTATASTLVQAKTQAEQGAIKIALSHNISATAKAQATLKLTTSVSAWCTTHVVPTPTATVMLVKKAFIDGQQVETPSGFGFTNNGAAFTNTGENTIVGSFDVGASVTICETNPMGWTPAKGCETQIVASNGNTFVFTNSKKTPPPPPKAPTVSAQAQACVNQGESNGVVNGTVTNPNGTADIADISLGGHSTSVSVAANGSASFSLSGFAPGTYSGIATLRTAGTSASFSVTVAQCPPSPPPKAPISITKVAEDAFGHVIPTPTNTFTFQVSADGQTYPVKYNSTPQDAGSCTVGSQVTITENVLSGWTIISANPQTFTCTSAGIQAVFKDQEVAPPPPPATGVCTRLSFSTNNLTATVTIGIATSGGASFQSALVDWGDNQVTSNGLVQSHTYAAAGPHTVNAAVTFSLPNGQKSIDNCSGSVTVTSPPPPINHPPTGSLQPPLHIFVNDTQPVCVDNVSDPDGDPVSLTFTFLDTNGNVVGTKVGSVWQQPGGAWCQYFKAPSTPQQVSVFVKLDDGHGGTPTLSDNIPVVPDQFSKS